MIDEVYNEEYYHTGCGPIPYEKSGPWVDFFGKVADRIVAELHPKTVLDAGCAMGYLVAALRDRGVEAYGIDISNYAISKVREDVRPFCTVGSLADPLVLPNFPQKFDLITSVEVLEHMSEEDGKKAIANLCRFSDTIMFSSSPDDVVEPTHINVQQREYWARIFAEQGFFDDLNYRPTYLTEWSMLFRRSNDWLGQLEKYERYVAQTSTAVQEKESQIHNLNMELEKIQNSRSWRITAPLRKIMKRVHSDKT